MHKPINCLNMTNFGYTLNNEGFISACGYTGNYDNYLDGSEPFAGFDCEFWKKDLQSGGWLYLPDITRVDKSIRNVEYDWQAMTASIYINDRYHPGPYVFGCTSTWAEQDCINAINSLDL